jgi:BON domain
MASSKQDERPSERKPRPGIVGGEHGEGSPEEATGVGPRSPAAPPQNISSEGGHPDRYGNVAPGRYGAYGYSSGPGHPACYESDARAPRISTAADAHPDSQPPARTRADERLRELIRQRLTEDPSIDASDVSMEVKEGEVTLFGTVESARTRADIEQCVENCGAMRIHNHLRTLS